MMITSFAVPSAVGAGTRCADGKYFVWMACAAA